MIPQHDIDAFWNLLNGRHLQSQKSAMGKLLEIIREQDRRVDELEAKVTELSERS